MGGVRCGCSGYAGPVTDLQASQANGSAPLALVTGASSGIGRALAEEFADNGFDVMVAAEDDIASVAQEIAGQTARKVVPVQVDLSAESGVEDLYGEVMKFGRPVDAAAINAGVGVGGRFDQTNLDEDLRLVDLNVRSTVHLSKLLVRDMVARGQGRMLFTASIAATAPGPYHATYAASKAFVHSFAEGIRVELKDVGVTVTSLMPGPTDTEFFARADMEDTKVGSGDKDDPRDVARDGFRALMAGKDHVVAGSMKNKVQAAASSVLPDRVAAGAQAAQTKPGSDDD
jgi:uncharacterized protein